MGVTNKGHSTSSLLSNMNHKNLPKHWELGNGISLVKLVIASTLLNWPISIGTFKSPLTSIEGTSKHPSLFQITTKSHIAPMYSWNIQWASLNVNNWKYKDNNT